MNSLIMIMLKYYLEYLYNSDFDWLQKKIYTCRCPKRHLPLTLVEYPKTHVTYLPLEQAPWQPLTWPPPCHMLVSARHRINVNTSGFVIPNDMKMFPKFPTMFSNNVTIMWQYCYNIFTILLQCYNVTIMSQQFYNNVTVPAHMVSWWELFLPFRIKHHCYI